MRAVLTSMMAAALAGPVAAVTEAPRPPSDARRELASLRDTLEVAVRRVSRSAALPGAAPQVYRLKGYGSVVVLSPRLVPLRPTGADREAQALAQAVRGLEDSLKRVRSGEVRAQIQASLRSLREAEARRTARPRVVVRRRDLTSDEAAAMGLSPDALQEVERQLQDDFAAHAQALRAAQDEMRRGSEEDQTFVQAFARMQAEAEAFRQDVDRMREQAERDVLERLQGPDVIATVPVAPPVPPAPPAPPAPPQPVTMGFPQAPSAPPVPEALPMPPPWRFWIQTEEEPEEDGDPGAVDAVVGRVREAVVAGLEGHRGELSLSPQEYVVAVVDFISRDTVHRRVARTLQVRVRAGDLAARRSGRMSAAEFRKVVTSELD
jgi:hypothetical protein